MEGGVGPHQPITSIPVDQTFDLRSWLEAEGVSNDVKNPALAADRVDDLDLSAGMPKCPDVSGLTTSACVKDGSVEFDALGRDSDDRPFGGRPIGISGGDFFRHRCGFVVAGGRWVESTERSSLLTVRRWIVSVLVLGTACSSGPAATTTTASVEVLREQIHAATGHDPEACISMMGEMVSIQIDDVISIPDCIIVQESAELVVTNASSVQQRFAVSDPANVNVRHDIYVLEIPAGSKEAIPEVGERTQSGVYPFYIRGGEPFSGFLVVVP